MAFTKAIKYQAKARIALAGPAGSGKTFTALTFATALADGGAIAVIDSERGSASKYADLFSFDVMELDNFHPDKFIKGIQEAQEAGYAVLVVDSISHAWNGTGGLLDIVDEIARRKYHGNTFSAWKDATPLQNAMIDAITKSSMHIIVTMRSKQDYAVETVNGKATPKKVGTAPIQRDGMEYEFDVVADMDIDNTMLVTKSRCSALSSKSFRSPDAKVMQPYKVWLQGEIPSTPAPAATTMQPAPAQRATNGATMPDKGTSTSHATNTVTSTETGAAQESKKTPPTVRQLQDRCNSIWGVGFFQTMLQKSAKTTETVIVKELTEEARWQASRYMDKAEAMKAANSTGK